MKSSLLRTMIAMSIFVFGFVFNTNAQLTNYTYAASTGATYTQLSGAGITTTTTLTNGTADDGNIVVTLPFTFNYNSVDYTQVTACTNGWLAMGSTTNTNAANTDLFTTTAPTNVIAGWWGNLNLNTANSGTFRYGTTATGVFTMQYDQFSGASTGATSATLKVRFQISLYGPTSSNPGAIEIIYGAPTGSVLTGRTIGIKAVNGTAAWINGTNGSTSSTATAAAYPAAGTRYLFTAPPYRSQFISANTGAANWCPGEVRNVTVTVKNIGSATWTTSSPVINIGAKWTGDAADYPFRVSAANLAPNATATFTIPVTAPATAGANSLRFDVVKEGLCWFRDNTAGCAGPGNVVFTSSAITIKALPTITKGANPTVCQGSTVANLTYSATTGTPTLYSIDYDAAANLAGFSDVVNASLPASPIGMVVPAAVAAGTYNGTLTVTSAAGCSSSAQAIAVTVNPLPTVTPGTGPTVCRGTTSALLSYTASGSANQYSINYDATANAAGFIDVTNAALPGGNISLVIPAAAAADVYNANLTVRNSTTGCVSVVSAITVTVNAPAVSFTGATTFCVGSGTTLSPTSGGTWVSNSPLVASVNNAGDVTGLTAGTATFTFTETATGCSSTTGSITVQGNSTLTFTSPAGTDAQTKCINTAITNITYLVGGGGTGASVSGLPGGVTGSYNSGTKVLTISGTPNVAGSFSYTVTTTGPCVNPSLGGTIDVTAASSITLTSGAGTNTQTKCINNAFTTITYAMGGTATGISITSGTLPAGVTGTFNAGVFTISGAPTVSGTFNYTVSTAGPCPLSLTGTLTVTADAALTRTSAVGTDAQTKCISTAITNITYLVAGSGTGATVSGLPTGVTGAYNSGTKVLTISGTPSVAGTFNYTVNATGPCINPSLSGSIIVTPNATISLTSAVGTDIQAACSNTPITNITYAIGGSGTGANATGLPAGLTTSYNAGVFTISGTATTNGTFNYTVTTTGPCVNQSLTGVIAVNAIPTVTIAASPATICVGGTSTLTATNSGGSPNPVFSGSNNTTVAIPDWSANAYTYSTISLAAGAATLANTDLLQVTVNITHGNDADLDIFLVDPSGTRAILLSSDNGGTGNNYSNTVFNTTAPTLITSGAAPFTGTFRPEGAINLAPDRTGNYIGGNYNAVVPANALTGAPITGAWSLRIFDDGFGNSGSLTSWSMSITKAGSYSTIFSGPGSFGPVTPAGGSTNTSPTVVVTPPVGLNAYTATTTDAVGCQSTTVVPVNVTVNANATITRTSAAGTDAQFTCNNSAITNIVYTLGGGGTGAGVTGLPSGVTGLYNSGVFTISGTPTVAGSYSYTVTTTGTCVQAVANGTITVGARPTTSFSAINVSSCSSVVDGSLTVNASGGTGPYTYSWTGMTGVGAHVPYTAGNTPTITGLDIGYYDVSIADAQGCSSSITGMHIQYAFSSFITHNGSISSGCANTGSIILYANAGVQPYSFSLDGTNYTSNNTFLNLAAGTYTAYVKDGAGCVITKSVFVAAAPPIVVNPFVRPASSCGADGVIEIYRTGGIPPYQYSMDGINYQVSNVYSNLPAGNYTTYVKDSKGCIGVTPVTVTQGAALAVTASKVNTSSCVNDGSIQVNPTGGLPPYQYKLGSGSFQFSNSFSGLAAGPYAITVKDSKGCQGNINVTINVNTIGVTYYAVPASSCAASDGTIQLFRTGGTGPYTYSLDGNTYQSSPIFTGLPAGTYDGFVKDSKTCIGATLSIELGPEGCNTLLAPVTFSKSETRSNSVKDNAVKVSANSVLKVNAYPNPSNAAFTLLLEGGNNAKVVITVTDLLGRKVYQAEGDVKKQYNFGNNFKTGMYILQVTQGNDKQSIKLVKE